MFGVSGFNGLLDNKKNVSIPMNGDVSVVDEKIKARS
jgi:hypothetical protein